MPLVFGDHSQVGFPASMRVVVDLGLHLAVAINALRKRGCVELQAVATRTSGVAPNGVTKTGNVAQFEPKALLVDAYVLIPVFSKDCATLDHPGIVGSDAIYWRVVADDIVRGV